MKAANGGFSNPTAASPVPMLSTASVPTKLNRTMRRATLFHTKATTDKDVPCRDCPWEPLPARRLSACGHEGGDFLHFLHAVFHRPVVEEVWGR
jgi:hypothetical protein